MRRQWGIEGSAQTYPDGAALGPVDDVVYIMQTGPAARLLGRAMLFAERVDASTSHLLVDEDAGVLARRAAQLEGAPSVWRIDGTSLDQVVPQPPSSSPPMPEAAADFLPLFASLGLDVVVEEGIVRAEVLGLEVARVEIRTDGVADLAVGIGRFDREATSMIHGGDDQEQTLAAAVTIVRNHRHTGAAPHPINRLARSRWLRSLVVADPSLVGARSLEPVPPLVAMASLTEVSPASAVGLMPDDQTVAVVCAAGVDLDLVPTAADMLECHRCDRVVLVAAERDLVDAQRRLAARLRVPYDLVAIAVPWGT